MVLQKVNLIEVRVKEPRSNKNEPSGSVTLNLNKKIGVQIGQLSTVVNQKMNGYYLVILLKILKLKSDISLELSCCDNKSGTV